ncbi:MAG: heme exporter protein CcmB [Gammaproteobacteria bacterium]|jgi:heme exporter protein B|nr:heme exporter protein CcmB [Pelagibacterales bacterium]MBT4109506.1 heme exporter protein CcmB [Pelagibacterales bacterium]MBT7543140.1 heme exporter protein CcmB [Gammaproteobacteria bacterium]MDG2268292.1 heme exporter protein CcmB [Alphaproteobacteria bacterium]
MNKFCRLILRDIHLVIKGSSDAAAALLFYLLAIIMFPLSSGTESTLLTSIAGGAIWVAALFSSLLSLDRLFRSDFEDGSLEQLALSGISLETIVLSKCFAHWLTNGLPIVILSPILALIIGLDFSYWWILCLTLLIGTPSLTLIGATPAALSCAIGKGGVLTALIILPLMLPVLILGSGAITAEISGLGGFGHIYALTAILPLSLLAVPFLASKALRLGWE